MIGTRIPLAFYTAVRGYSWHCTNGRFSESDYSMIEGRAFAENDVGDHPVACVFSSGDQVFFSRYLKAVNFDSDMRSADYYVVGVVPKYEARNVDFKWIFQSDVFAKPISRECASEDRFPSYLDYGGGGATNGMRPLEDRPEQLDADGLSSIGSWIGSEDGDAVVCVYNEIARPVVHVKTSRRLSQDVGSNESCAATCAARGPSLQDNQKEEDGKESVPDDGIPKKPESPVVRLAHMLMRVCALPRQNSDSDGIGLNERHDFTQPDIRDTTHLGGQVCGPEQSHGKLRGIAVWIAVAIAVVLVAAVALHARGKQVPCGKMTCPTCNGTGFVSGASSSQSFIGESDVFGGGTSK